MAMSRKLYLHFTAQRFDGYINAQECLADMERDFANDSGGKDHIDEADFRRSFFQLADVHTDTVDGRSYAELVLGCSTSLSMLKGCWCEPCMSKVLACSPIASKNSPSPFPQISILAVGARAWPIHYALHGPNHSHHERLRATCGIRAQLWSANILCPTTSPQQ